MATVPVENQSDVTRQTLAIQTLEKVALIDSIEKS
jgi:hypothetical protein